MQHHLPPPDAAAARAAALRYGVLVEGLAAVPAANPAEFTTTATTTARRWPNPAQPGKPLRIGLLSPDLRQHPVGNFTESVLTGRWPHRPVCLRPPG